MSGQHHAADDAPAGPVSRTSPVVCVGCLVRTPPKADAPPCPISPIFHGKEKNCRIIQYPLCRDVNKESQRDELARRLSSTAAKPSIFRRHTELKRASCTMPWTYHAPSRRPTNLTSEKKSGSRDHSRATEYRRTRNLPPDTNDGVLRQAGRAHHQRAGITLLCRV